MKLTNLDSATIPLTGRHLIEASAGTGKTYNITRIYLRLLLERELKVEEILLMTFTKDATQELRGRIDAFIREALNNWQALCVEDKYFQAINERVSSDKIEFLLKRALLFLDEAAIFTIHGFCQRALTQHAFASGLPFNANMSTNSNELILQATQDWYRQLAKQKSDDFSLISEFWSTPDAFIASFAKAITHTSEILVVDAQDIVVKFVQLAKQANSDLLDNASLLAEGLVSHKKADEQEKRTGELIKLQDWLAKVADCQDEQSLLAEIKQPYPDYLLNGNRHPKAFKAQLAQVLSAAKEIKEQVKKLPTIINKANAYQLVRKAIYQIRAQVKQSKIQLNTLDFNDLINTLADCLQSTSQVEENRLAKTLLAQYPVALVDEFQDTDPQQFAILQGIYYQAEPTFSSTALYLIGDPKQAIYGFRGGDIFAYLNARSDCDHHWLMDTNWRSSPLMIAGYNQVFLGHEQDSAEVKKAGSKHSSVFGYGIEYQGVLAGKSTSQSILSDNKKALQFIHFSGEDESEKVKQSARPIMASWCANEIVTLLNQSGAQEQPKVKPQDIAILVRDGREASDIKAALLNANLASVYLADRANLFHSEQAMQLVQLLQGILNPEDERIYLRALVCGLLGFNAQALYKLQCDELAYQHLKFEFFNYREQWQRQGFITMAMTLMHQHFDFTSADSLNNKDRILTNVLHLFEVLQSASQRFLQPQELLAWFEQQCNEEHGGSVSELEAEQRLESDGDLIRIVTQHGAKGLEYPIVFIPFATRHKDPLKFGNKSVSYLEYHNEQGQLCLSLDGDDHAKKAMADEAYAESIRLLYVAITRAEQRCYILSTAFDKYSLSPLGKTLQWQAEQNISQHLQQLADKAPQSISQETVAFDDINSDNSDIFKPLDEHQSELEVSKFVGSIERDWWLSSFSALSRNLRHGGVSTPDRDFVELLDSHSSLNSAKNEKNSLRFQLAKGAHSGNLLHDILEKCNFKTIEDAENNIIESIKWPLVKYGDLATGFSVDDLATWIDEIVATPLACTSNHQQSFCLSNINMQNTLRESEFYFPMAQADIASLGKLLTDHRNINSLSSTCDNNKTINKVRLPSYQSLKGMMHGFIDLVFEYNGKYYVCDYKSSHLGDAFCDYSYEAMKGNIEKNYYDLQYLIYCLALHRYLKQKVADYDPSEHFGGIYYLYLRGMTNNDSHKGAGVYHRQICLDLLSQLDKLFLGEHLEKTPENTLENTTSKEQS